MSTTFDYGPRRAKPSRKSYAPPPSKVLCAGFDRRGSECRSLASYDGFCAEHKGLKFWDSPSAPSIKERRLHAHEGKCNGIAASTGSLCNRKINGCTFCHSHWDQRPPDAFFLELKEHLAWLDCGFELATKAATVKKNLMIFCQIYEEWSQAGREARRKAEEDYDRRRKAAQKAHRAWEEERRQAEATFKERARNSTRREEEARAAEEKRKKAEAETERLRKEHARQKAAEEERRKKFERDEDERRRKEEARQKKAAEAERAQRTMAKELEEAIVNDYCRSCIEFDRTKFSTSNPSSFRVIPWPILVHRSRVTSNQVDWKSVRDFFQFVKCVRGAAEQRRLLEQARLRYHPNRWAGRNVISSVLAEEERKQVEQIGLAVSQEVNHLFDALSD